MTRSIWKLIYLNKFIFKLQKKNLSFSNQVIKIWSRNNTILKNFFYKKILVYNGRFFLPIIIKKEFLNYKFGEFIFTKKLGKTIHFYNKKILKKFKGKKKFNKKLLKKLNIKNKIKNKIKIKTKFKKNKKK